MRERFLAAVDATGWRRETFPAEPDTVTIYRLRRRAHARPPVEPDRTGG
jgi:hypothetical protein